MFEQPVLDVDLVLLVARKRGVEPGQQSSLVPGGKLVLKQEIGAATRVAEEQPVASARARRLALLQKGAKRRDPGARPNHDDWAVGGSKAHPRGGVDIDRNLRAGGKPVAQKG